MWSSPVMAMVSHLAINETIQYLDQLHDTIGNNTNWSKIKMANAFSSTYGKV